jgi:hypothetical protein
MNRTKCLWSRQDFYLIIALAVALALPSGKTILAAENESVQHYKMLSTVEYTGPTQFRNQVDTLLTVKKQFLSDNKVHYLVSSNDLNLAEGGPTPDQQSSAGELSFVIDKNTKYLSVDSKDIELLEKINNRCVSSLKNVTKNNIGKTWKQSFTMPFLNHLIPGELNLTLTAIQLKTKVFGEMIAVRALSEPFVIKATNAKGATESVRARTNAVYLFDPKMEDIYMSISVFEAETNSKEKLRHEVATYKTDATGKSVDLSGLGSEFEKLVRKVGLTTNTIKVTKESPLPQWAQYEGLATSQVANICAATACEGAPNPVATIYVPVARTVALQSIGKLASTGKIGAISTALATKVTGVAGMKIAVAPALMGGMGGLGTAGAVAGGATAVAVGAGGGGGGGNERSPSTP